ncbi:MAG: DUF4097 family beta strand repeat-containing protein [Spirochaetales bacterium]
MRKITVIIKLIILVLLLSFFVSVLLRGFVPFGIVNDNHSWSSVPILTNGRSTENATLISGLMSLPSDNIDRFVIDSVSGNIDVRLADNDEITVEYSGGDVDCYYQQTGNTLYVFIEWDNQWFTFNSTRKEGNITVYIPKDLQHSMTINAVSSPMSLFAYGDGCSIDTVSGSVDIYAGYRTITCDTVSGNLVVRHIEEYPTTLIDFDTVSGDMILQGDFIYDLDFESLSGKIRDTNGQTSGAALRISADSVSGNFSRQ